MQREGGAVWVKVIAGEALGTKATIRTKTPITFLDVRLQPGHSLTQPVMPGHNGFVYVYKGAGSVGSTALKESQMGILGNGDAVTITAPQKGDLHCLLVTGEPLGEPVVKHGPFVMNTESEIRQAFSEYQSGKLGGKIAGQEDRYAATRRARSLQQENGTL